MISKYLFNQIAFTQLTTKFCILTWYVFRMRILHDYANLGWHWNVLCAFSVSKNISFVFPAFVILCCNPCGGLLFSSNNRDVPRSNEAEDSDAARVHPGREPSAHWAGIGSSPYLPSGVDDVTSSYPYLPPVMEEPSSSLSEGISLFRFWKLCLIFEIC